MSRVFTIDGTIETPSNYDEDELSDIIIELMKEKGFLFTGDMSFLEEIPDIDDETKPSDPDKENDTNLNLSETNGDDIRECQCFTCQNKISKDAIAGFYEGSYEAYKNAIEHVRDLFPDDSSPDWLKIKELISRLNYERDCSGALLEDVETGNYWRMVNAKIH